MELPLPLVNFKHSEKCGLLVFASIFLIWDLIASLGQPDLLPFPAGGAAVKTACRQHKQRSQYPPYPDHVLYFHAFLPLPGESQIQPSSIVPKTTSNTRTFFFFLDNSFFMGVYWI